MLLFSNRSGFPLWLRRYCFAHTVKKKKKKIEKQERISNLNFFSNFIVERDLQILSGPCFAQESLICM